MEDVLAASKVVFVGFSLNDLDFRRMLGTLSPHVRAKIHFINHPGTTKPTQTRLRKFGELHLIDASDFGRHLGSPHTGAPTKTLDSVPISIQELQFDFKPIASISSKDIQGLLVAGVMNIAKLSQADVTCIPGSYTITRNKRIYERVFNQAPGARPILIHSDIGNGKSILAMQLAYLHAQADYRVFKMRREPENFGPIISFFQSIPGKVLVIFDDLMRFRSLASSIIAIGREDIKILATVRSPLLETARGAVEARLGRLSAIEIDLNVSAADEIARLSQYLTENGLWGDYADLTEAQKVSFIEKACGSQFRDVVLALYENGALHERVAQLLGNIGNLDDQSRRLILFSAFLTYADFKGYNELYILFDLVGYDGDFEDLRNALFSNELSGLIQIDSGELELKSTALSEFIIKNAYNIQTLLDVVKDALFIMDKHYLDDNAFFRLSKGLLKFSNYGRLIKTAADKVKIREFYDSCRVLKVATFDPLFWVQRSICSMKERNLEALFQFADTAYATAKSRIGFDTYQIDNH